MKYSEKNKFQELINLTSGLTSASQLVDSTGLNPPSLQIDQTSLSSPMTLTILSKEEFERKKLKEEIKKASEKSKKENWLAFKRLAKL